MCCFDGCSYVCMDPVPSEAGNLRAITTNWEHARIHHIKHFTALIGLSTFGSREKCDSLLDI